MYLMALVLNGSGRRVRRIAPRLTGRNEGANFLFSLLSFILNILLQGEGGTGRGKERLQSRAKIRDKEQMRNCSGRGDV